MVPVIRPASPVGPSSSTAAPLVTESTGVAPPSARLTLLIARRTVWVSASGPLPPGTPLAPYEVDRSTTRSPRRLWPSTVSTMPVPSKRTYGPALTSRATAVPPTSTLAVTGSVVVLTARVRAPVSVVPAGRVTTRAPEMRPATPADVTSRRPLPPVIRTPLPPAPMLRSTRFRPIVVTVGSADGGPLDHDVGGEGLALHGDGEPAARDPQVRAGGQVEHEGGPGDVDAGRDRCGDGADADAEARPDGDAGHGDLDLRAEPAGDARRGQQQHARALGDRDGAAQADADGARRDDHVVAALGEREGAGQRLPAEGERGAGGDHLEHRRGRGEGRRPPAGRRPASRATRR